MSLLIPNGSNKVKLRNLSRLIKVMRDNPGEHTSKQLMPLAHLSQTTVAFFLREMHKAGIVEVRQDNSPGLHRCFQCKLIGTQEEIDAFLGEQKNDSPVVLPRRLTTEERAARDEQEDRDLIPKRVSNLKPFYDPLGLPREFFRSAAA